MNTDKITVRQWQELYRAGAFAREDQDTQELADWTDLSEPLNSRRIISLTKLVLSITHPFILDNYSIFFSEDRPNVGRTYGLVVFTPLSKDRFRCLFRVDLDYPDAQKKWALSTRRYGEGEPEFECGHIRHMIRYIHAMADDLEHNTKPDFWPEKEAAQQFVFNYLPSYTYTVLRREGAHSYSTYEQATGRRIVLHVAHRPEDAPPGFQAQDAVPVLGLYVFPQKDAEKILNPLNIDKRAKEKECQR